jgi:nitrogen fixation protein NifU and related proteins
VTDTSLYQELILDHDRYPRQAGLREPFDTEVQRLNPTCGDEIVLRIRREGEVVADISYDAVGCAISRASASMMCELLTGATLAEATVTADAFTQLVTPRGATANPGATPVRDDAAMLGDAVALAGVARYPARIPCALLAWTAWREAASSYSSDSTASDSTASNSTGEHP